MNTSLYRRTASSWQVFTIYTRRVFRSRRNFQSIMLHEFRKWHLTSGHQSAAHINNLPESADFAITQDTAHGNMAPARGIVRARDKRASLAQPRQDGERAVENDMHRRSRSDTAGTKHASVRMNTSVGRVVLLGLPLYESMCILMRRLSIIVYTR